MYLQYYRLSKTRLDHILKSVVFRTCFHSEHVKAYETLVKPAWKRFYHIFSLLWVEIIWKMSPLVKLEMLGLFFNTMTADDKYPIPDCKNLEFPI